MTTLALTDARIVTPDVVLDEHALVLAGDTIAAVLPRAALDPAVPHHSLGGGWLLPGFIDVQVNGGGDVLFNDRPTVDGLRAIAEAHRRFGTTGLLPTLISDDHTVLEQGIAAVEQAMAEGVPGILGIHIEGPYLNPAKHGIHDRSKFRLLDEAVVGLLSKPSRGKRLVTIAPELAPPGAIAALVRAGVIVAAGHSMADYDATRSALEEGLTVFTHLFNAMTPLESRAPGMVGAALEDRASWCGLIADGVHVHPAAMRVALAARGADGIVLVTDAMPPVGGENDRFTLMGREIRVIDGTCRAADGTLAGSALSMAQALRNALSMLRVPMADASRLASGNAAALLGIDTIGAIRPGLRADLVHLGTDLTVRATWIAGERQETVEER